MRGVWALCQRSGWERGVLDREPHVGGADLGLDRAVCVFDEGVDGALWVDDDLNFLVGHVEEPVRLDDLEALVHQGRGVDGDLVAHAPGRVSEGFLGSYVLEFINRTLSEGDRRRL